MKQPKEKEIIAAYNKADEKGKELLKSLYPDVEFEPASITEYVKTFEDACRELGEEHLLVENYQLWKWNQCTDEVVDRNLEAYMKLRIIIAALNEDWDVRKQTEGYYWRVIFRGGNYAYASNGLAFVGEKYNASHTYSNASSRLVFKSKGLADYCAKQFADLWKDYFVG